MGAVGTGAFGFVLATAACLMTARAAEWSMAPTLDVSVDHDSNRTLLTEAIPSEGLSMSADALLQRATEDFSLSLHPQVLLQRFTDRRFNRNDDGGLTAGATWSTERSTFALSSLYQDQSTLTAELISTGIVNLNTRLREEQEGATWAYSQTERREFTLTASYLDATYYGNATTPLQDYTYGTVTGSEQYMLSERLSVSLSGSAGEYNTKVGDNLTQLTGASLGVIYEFTDRVHFSADAGLNRRVEHSNASQGFVGDLVISRKTSTGSFGISASRGVVPSGYGFFTQTDQVRLQVLHDLEERLSADANISIYRNKSLFSTIDLEDRTYSQVLAGLTWRTTETSTIGLHAYGNRARSTGGIGPYYGDASGWGVRLDSAWSPLPFSFSR
jgi:hypothetical protein